MVVSLVISEGILGVLNGGIGGRVQFFSEVLVVVGWPCCGGGISGSKVGPKSPMGLEDESSSFSKELVVVGVALWHRDGDVVR